MYCLARYKHIEFLSPDVDFAALHDQFSTKICILMNLHRPNSEQVNPSGGLSAAAGIPWDAKEIWGFFELMGGTGSS